MRIALGIEYDGTYFHGWQHQEGLPTVQYALQKALTAVANHPIEVLCAGRTDAGVHAVGQVVHFDTSTSRTDYSWVFGTNTNLPGEIRVHWAKGVDESFHARYSATARQYRYMIYNHPIRPALLRNNVTWHYRDLQVDRMQEGANHLIGEHDFSSYRGISCQSRTPMREIFSITLKRQSCWISLEICANSFLHHMVRNIVGVLLAIGEGKRDPSWAHDVLLAKDRTQGGITAPSSGLYMTKVTYPAHYNIPVPELELLRLPGYVGDI